MQDNLKGLINSIVQGSDKYARQYARMLLKADKAQKDRNFVERMLSELDKQDEKIQIPANCSSFLVAEKDPDINLSRYLLTERDAAKAGEVIKMHRVSHMLSDIGIHAPNTVFLHGEPGVGKTAYGRYLAKMAGLPFIYVNLSYLVDSLLGRTQQNVGNMFRFISSIDCVFMMDEIDAIALKRGQSNDIGEMARVTIALMQEIDKFKGNSILVAATNIFDSIDEAILSRFSVPYEVRRFNGEERKRFVKMYLDDAGIGRTDLEEAALYRPDVPQRELERAVIRFIADKMYHMVESEGSGNGNKEKE